MRFWNMLRPMSTDPFFRALRLGAASVAGDARLAGTHPQELVLDFARDPLWETNITDLAQFTAVLFSFVYAEDALSLTFWYNDFQIGMLTNDRECELVSPPAPFFVDVVRQIVRASRVTADRAGRLPVRLAGRVVPLLVDYVGPPRPGIRISGFRPEKRKRKRGQVDY